MIPVTPDATANWSARPVWERQQLGDVLRDEFFSEQRKPGADFLAAIENVDAQPTVRIDGLWLCRHPTRVFKSLRFVESSKVPETLRRGFVRVARDWLAAFADPRDLAFHNFENIVTLDRFFGRGTPSLTARDAELSSLGDIFTFQLDADAHTRTKLEALDGLGFYVPPLNASSRGGERFIFHCASLAEGLTSLLRTSLPSSMRSRFVHVNPVFRCNRFEPGDEKFYEHLDTPYVDRSRNHISRFTLLLYVTGGQGAPALAIEGVDVLTQVGAMTCAIFDQRYAHEGKPYLDGRKVFLRTELIFDALELPQREEFSAQFAKATYLTAQSVFQPELSKYAERIYEQHNRSHWEGVLRSRVDEPVLMKRWRGVHFATNGYDFFFDEKQPLDDCAAISLLDVLNAEVEGVAFRKRCETQVASDGIADWVKSGEIEKLTALPLSSLLPRQEASLCCCHQHSGSSWDARLAGEVLELERRAQGFVTRLLEKAPVLIFGNELFLNSMSFDVQVDRIHVLSERALEPIHFAACRFEEEQTPPDCVRAGRSVRAMHLLVPPILWSVHDGLIHLRFDFFRNGWWVPKQRVDVVPLPEIPSNEELQTTQAPTWLDAAGSLSQGREVAQRSSYDPWWSTRTYSQERKLVDILWTDD
ncbi:MAG: hypothetical protein QM817_23740 [Archangium sp.]